MMSQFGPAVTLQTAAAGCIITALKAQLAPTCLCVCVCVCDDPEVKGQAGAVSYLLVGGS